MSLGKELGSFVRSSVISEPNSHWAGWQLQLLEPSRVRVSDVLGPGFIYMQAPTLFCKSDNTLVVVNDNVVRASSVYASIIRIIWSLPMAPLSVISIIIILS